MSNEMDETTLTARARPTLEAQELFEFAWGKPPGAAPAEWNLFLVGVEHGCTHECGGAEECVCSGCAELLEHSEHLTQRAQLAEEKWRESKAKYKRLLAAAEPFVVAYRDLEPENRYPDACDLPGAGGDYDTLATAYDGVEGDDGD